MIAYRELGDERLMSYTPVGLWLVDEFTGAPPLDSVQARLEVKDPSGAWRGSDVEPVSKGSGRFVWPDLGKTASPGSTSAAWRVAVESPRYVPYYRRNVDGLEFQVWPHNDLQPPQQHARTFAPGNDWRLLLPGSGYPFPSHVRVVRGRVVQAPDGSAVRDALVSFDNQERVLTDSLGTFALPVRWPPAGPNLVLDVAHLRTGRMAQHTVPLADAFTKNQSVNLP